MGNLSGASREPSADSETAADDNNAESEAAATPDAPVEDDLDDLEFLLEEIENRIAPLA